MNKNLIFSLLIVLLLPSLLFSQSENVGINTTSPDNSAALHVTYVTTPKGILIPRMTTTERGNIPIPTNALLIYNTTTNQFEYYDAGNTSWVGLSTVTTYTVDQFVSTDGSGNLQTFDFSQDLSSTTAGVATVTGIQTRAVSTTAPTDGQVLQWNNSTSEWEPTTPSGAATYTADRFLSTDGSGNIQTFDFSQDLSSTTAGVATVTGIQSRAVSSTAPTNGQVLQWNNSSSEWEPTTLSGGSTYTADRFLSTDGSGNIQTFDFSQDLSSTTAGVATVTGIQTRAVSTTAPTDGQVLQWDNSASEWVSTTPSGGGGGGNTLDEAYDEGGNGSGRTVNVTDGAVQFTSTNAADESVEITNSGNGGVLLVENTGTGQSLLVNDEASDTTPFAIDDEGNVGVKTNAPTASLDVEGDFKLGDDGTVLDAVIKETITFRPPAVNANSSVVSTQTVTGATVGSTVIVTPDEDFGNGRLVIAFAWVETADDVSIRFTNVTGTNQNLGSNMDWHITIIK